MKTIDLLKKIEETQTISESEIQLLKNRMNKGEKIDMDFIWNNDIQLSNEQNPSQHNTVVASKRRRDKLHMQNNKQQLINRNYENIICIHSRNQRW